MISWQTTVMPMTQKKTGDAKRREKMLSSSLMRRALSSLKSCMKMKALKTMELYFWRPASVSKWNWWMAAVSRSLKAVARAHVVVVPPQKEAACCLAWLTIPVGRPLESTPPPR